MKKAKVLLVLAVALLLLLTACRKQETGQNMQENQTKQDIQTELEHSETENPETEILSSGEETENNQNQEGTTMAENRRIRLTFDGGEMLVNLAENSAADDLLERLPLTLSFEDFNGTEKISYLESELDLSDAPDACTPRAGDLTYYAPWGNLAFFYRDFRRSPQLIPLGSIESGAEYLEQLDTYSQVVMEQYE